MRGRRWLGRWLPVAAWMGLIYVLSAQPDLPHPASGWLDLAVSSGAHVLLYAGLALLLRRALGDQHRAWWLALALAGAYGVSDELHQALVPGRHPDAWDLACDLLGSLVGVAGWQAWRRRARLRAAGASGQ